VKKNEFASDAWVLKGMTGSEAGWLDIHDGNLRFTKPDGVVFDVPLSQVTDVKFPWFYFGGGAKLRAAGVDYRFSFVRPNGAEYASAKLLADNGNAGSLLIVASKAADIGSGRSSGERWRELLEGAGGAA
jgi:hypothetical protein